jgi:hypothetical protein
MTNSNVERLERFLFKKMKNFMEKETWAMEDFVNLIENTLPDFYHKETEKYPEQKV